MLSLWQRVPTISERPEGRHLFSQCRFAFAVLVTSGLVGLVGGLLFLLLRDLDLLRRMAIGRVAGWSISPLLVFGGVGCAAVTAAAWLAKRFAPSAVQAGIAYGTVSGHDEDEGSVPADISVNFAGTALAAGAGLAIGPERPAQQVAEAISRVIARLFGLTGTDVRLLAAAAGGAGIATMFNAPLGCAVYTVHIILRRTNFKIGVTALGAGAIAVAVERVLLGSSKNFTVTALEAIPHRVLLLYLLLGAGIGLISWVHQYIAAVAVQRIGGRRPNVLLRAAVVGGVVGILAWVAPAVVGPGDAVAQGVFDGHFEPWLIAVLLGARLLLGPVSIAAGTPGGYFTPALAIGALAGAGFASLCRGIGGLSVEPSAFAIAGMAAALSAMHRAAFTGVLLTIETTGAFQALLPAAVAAFGAGVVTIGLGSPALAECLARVGALQPKPQL
jgi:CIC family chloride channel protein